MNNDHFKSVCLLCAGMLLLHGPWALAEDVAYYQSFYDEEYEKARSSFDSMAAGTEPNYNKNFL